MHGSTRLAATSESEIILGVELANGLVAGKRGGLIREWLRHLVLDIQGGVDTTLALRGSNKALVSTLGIGALIDRERVIAGLGEGVDLRAPTISAVSPSRDRLALLGRGLIEMSERRSLGFLFAQVGLDPLSSHHDTRLVLL